MEDKPLISEAELWYIETDKGICSFVNLRYQESVRKLSDENAKLRQTLEACADKLRGWHGLYPKQVTGDDKEVLEQVESLTHP